MHLLRSRLSLIGCEYPETYFFVATVMFSSVDYIHNTDILLSICCALLFLKCFRILVEMEKLDMGPPEDPQCDCHEEL